MNSTRSADKALLFFVFFARENLVFENQKILRSAQQKIMVLKNIELSEHRVERKQKNPFSKNYRAADSRKSQFQKYKIMQNNTCNLENNMII